MSILVLLLILAIFIALTTWARADSLGGRGTKMPEGGHLREMAASRDRLR